MNEKQTTISASLCISGAKSFDLERVTTAVGFEPTCIWRCKPEVAKRNPELDRVEWRYELEDFQEIEYSRALERIMDVFAEYPALLKELAEQFDLSVGFHLVPRGEKRDFIPFFESTVIQRLAGFNAALTVHLDRLE